MPRIKIRAFQGKPVCNGFFPRENQKLNPGEEFEVSDEEAEALLATRGDLIEVVYEPPKRGRPKNAEA